MKTLFKNSNLFPKSVSRCDQSYLSNYCIENDDWRPTQELLLTRFAEVKYSEMFRTINQDYGSFYSREPTLPCIPDVLKEKIYKRYMNSLLTQSSHRHTRNQCENNLFPQCNTQTITVTHRKKFSACHIDDLIIDFLVKQIQHRLKSLIDPNDYHDVSQCAKILVTELLSKEPSLCAEDVINRVIGIMNTPLFC